MIKAHQAATGNLEKAATSGYVQSEYKGECDRCGSYGVKTKSSDRKYEDTGLLETYYL
jgi:hypothetical protein